ncbi:NAD(P)H-dependent glycerol-3-phosphate dehydrogenase [Woodsholea maritima]|uniref:NAD(P)H-dependent glycerol-3-phosphate dehydrogenase n=1 Tax=Woodsholea maritima TaxID=240237 RepID=UPI0003610EE3|nr:NAD(P)H-dependent glycerol-3-phosphate dehydrogenase [Woodsholea maritima]
MSEIKHIGVIGAGAWGTALAQTAAKAGRQVTLWAYEGDVVEAINSAHENTVFLPGVTLDPALRATQTLSDLAACDAILSVTPAQHMRAVMTQFVPHTRDGLPIVLCSKGIERGSLMMMSEVLAETNPKARAAVLSGPSFAIDVAKGLPTAVTLACADETLGKALMQAISAPTFRPYYADDLIGAEIGGAVKNVLAIACGISEGKGLGKSAHAALISRGFAELTRLAIAMGAKRETLSGLCGLGDLVLTCSSPQSRNMSCGLALGQGQSLDAIMGERRAVTEGVASAPAIVELAAKHGVDMPICQGVHHILSGGAGVEEMITALLSRPLTEEGH